MLHKKLMPVLVNAMLPFGEAQLVLLEATALAVGGVSVLFTVALAVLVQPFEPVIVTV